MNKFQDWRDRLKPILFLVVAFGFLALLTIGTTPRTECDLAYGPGGTECN